MRWLVRGEPTLPAHTGWLGPREAAYLATLRFTKRRTEFLLRRHAGKAAIAAWLGLPDDTDTLARLEISNLPSGAPLPLLDGEPAPVALSLTDRAGWAVALVGDTDDPSVGSLGVDLEIAEPRSEGFIDDFLTVAEAAWVREQSDRDAAANLVWSAKEAALKVLQVGLRADTRTVEVTAHPVDRSDGWAALEVRHAVDDEVFTGWWRRDGVFLLTIAARVRAEPPGALPGTSDLAAAEPVDSWVDNPLV